MWRRHRSPSPNAVHRSPSPLPPSATPPTPQRTAASHCTYARAPIPTPHTPRAPVQLPHYSAACAHHTRPPSPFPKARKALRPRRTVFPPRTASAARAPRPATPPALCCAGTTAGWSRTPRNCLHVRACVRKRAKGGAGAGQARGRMALARGVRPRQGTQTEKDSGAPRGSPTAVRTRNRHLSHRHRSPAPPTGPTRGPATPTGPTRGPAAPTHARPHARTHRA
mgnify:CR=1 FL=1